MLLYALLAWYIIGLVATISYITNGVMPNVCETRYEAAVFGLFVPFTGPVFPLYRGWRRLVGRIRG